MNKLCCISASLAARIIGTYTMSLSLLMINVLMSNFFSRKGDEEFFESCKTWAMLGLNWIQILRNTQLQKRAQTAMTCFLVYVLLFLLASAYLALGSISRRHKSAVPWMYLQMISIIDQSVALSIHLTHDRQYDILDRSIWYIPASSIYLILSVYLWMVVHAARKEWFNEQQNRLECEAPISSPLSMLATSNSLKTPSFLSQNFSMFESPRPPTIQPK